MDNFEESFHICAEGPLKTLVVMAAGLGSRYGGLKQLERVGPSGEIMMDYAIYDAKRAGFQKVVFIIKKEDFELFKEVVGDRIAKTIMVEYSFQSDDAEQTNQELLPKKRVKPWGTGHAVMCCENKVTEPFVVINADDFYGFEAFKKASKWLEENNICCERKNKKSKCFEGYLHKYGMVGYILKNTLTKNGHVSRGVCSVDKGGRLLSVTERTKIIWKNGHVKYAVEGPADTIEWCDLDESSIVSMNFWCFTPSIFPQLKIQFKEFLSSCQNLQTDEFMLPSAVQNMIDSSFCAVEVLTTSDSWFGMTYKEDKATAQDALSKEIKSGKYPVSLPAKKQYYTQVNEYEV